jgi:hypothetical protein
MLFLMIVPFREEEWWPLECGPRTCLCNHNRKVLVPETEIPLVMLGTIVI